MSLNIWDSGANRGNFTSLRMERVRGGATAILHVSKGKAGLLHNFL